MKMNKYRYKIINCLITHKKEPAGLAGGSALTPVRLKVPANALRAYNNLTGRVLLATRKRV